MHIPSVLVAALGLLLLVTPVRTSGQAVAVEGTVRGQVLDEGTGAGVPAVQVEFLDAGDRVRASATTDGEGSFVLARVPGGSFRLRTGRIGYPSVTTEPARVEPGEILTVVLRIHPEAIPLDPLEVTARVRTVSPVLEGFRFRRERGVGGTFLGREEIEREGPTRLTDLLQRVPGIRITAGPGFGSARLVSMIPPGPGRADGTCPVQVFMNGVPASRRILMAGGGGLSALDGVPVDDLAHPSDLEGIEIYRGLAATPPEFLTPDAGCGVIAIWTHRDP